MQFGFLSCFGAAFPLSAALAFGLNIVQIKQDGYKLLHLSRRPLTMEARVHSRAVTGGVVTWRDIKKREGEVEGGV